MRLSAQKAGICFFLLGGVLLAGSAAAADYPGAKDPPSFKRFPGAQLVYANPRNFDDYALVVSDPAKPGATRTENFEGQVTRLFYRVPAGNKAAEVFVFYQGVAKAAGFAAAWQLPSCAIATNRTMPDQLYNAVQDPNLANTPLMTRTGSYVFANSVGQFCAFTAIKGTAEGLTVAVVQEADKDAQNRMLMIPAPVTFAPGEILVMIDVITAKKPEIRMINVK